MAAVLGTDVSLLGRYSSVLQAPDTLKLEQACGSALTTTPAAERIPGNTSAQALLRPGLSGAPAAPAEDATLDVRSAARSPTPFVPGKHSSALPHHTLEPSKAAPSLAAMRPAPCPHVALPALSAMQPRTAWRTPSRNDPGTASSVLGRPPTSLEHAAPEAHGDHHPPPSDPCRAVMEGAPCEVLWAKLACRPAAMPGPPRGSLGAAPASKNRGGAGPGGRWDASEVGSRGNLHGHMMGT